MAIRHRTYTLGEQGTLFNGVPVGTWESLTLQLNGVFLLYPTGDNITQLPLPSTGTVRVGLIDVGKATFYMLTGSVVAYTDPIDSKQRLGANASGLE